MAQLTQPTISPKMFRHFAIVTVAITVALAVFADGENREAMATGVAETVAERKEAQRIEQAQVAKFGKPKLVARPGARKSDWGTGGYGDAFDASYGTPSDRTSEYARTTAVWRGRSGSAGARPASYAPPGVTQAKWDSMSDDQREEYLRQLERARAPGKPVSAQQHEREVESLMAASAARAGGASEGED